ncbi:hypothetical protein [Streptosporangium roseum]|uniref:hypothetical protein n=1 Tax=Streptosporangium roseum TaxID=2001 RepID=UPI0004CD6093|nr:hypothetical protein [Streptosporangium roseum]
MKYRLDPAAEAEAARGNLLGGLYTGGIASLVFAYMNGWVPELTGGVQIPRDVELFPWLAGGTGLASVLFTVALVVRVVRWQIALSQRRRARDPVKALLLPPSAEHGAALRMSRPGRTTLGNVLTLALPWVAFPLVIVALGTLLTPGRMGSRTEEATLVAAVAGGAGLVVLLVVAVDVTRRRLLARQVRKLSQDPAFAELMPPATAALSRYRAPVIPELKITYYAPPAAIVFGLTKVSAAHNVFGHPPLSIVYFRLFENELRVRDFVKGAFRRCGYVHLLRSAASVRLSELMRVRRDGTIGELFIASDRRMQRELDARPREPLPRGFRVIRGTGGRGVRVWDFKGGYPMSTYLCHGAYWKRAVDTLLDLADLVVIDLSGFQRENIGTGYELQRVIDRYPIHRVVVLADTGSDTRYLATHIRHAWSRMAPDSPNAGDGTRSLLVGQIAIGGQLATYPLLAHAHKRLR